MNYTLNVSVHDVVDTILRRGHIDNRIFNTASMNEGSNIHRFYQEAQLGNYEAEYYLADTFQVDNFTLKVSGKADGIFNDGTDWVIEEIKSTKADLDDFSRDHSQWHLGQALFYAYMYAKSNNLKAVKVLLTYISQSDRSKKKQIEKLYKFEDISNFVHDVISRYVTFIKKIQALKEERDASWVNIPFPFAEYRQGQKRMIDFISKAQDENRNVYIEAPTGIGKTVSVLYPSLKRFGEKKADQIFYLTSKNSIKKIAINTLKLFKAMGSKAKCVEFTSKENLCFNDLKGHCNPEECPFARNFYDKLLEAIVDELTTEDVIDRKAIEKICYEREMCPYQFQFEIAKYVDVLICDYSYVFDMTSPLKYLNEEPDLNLYLLIDECHNLPDRVKDMYSLELDIKDVEEAYHRSSGVYLKKVHKALKKLKDLLTEKHEGKLYASHQQRLLEIEDISEDIMQVINDIIVSLRDNFKKSPEPTDDKLLSFYFLLLNFNDLYTLADNDEDRPNFCFYYVLEQDDSVEALKIANISSRKYIMGTLKNFNSAIFFSATLSPKEYYIDLLGGNNKDLTNRLVLESPFPKENCKVLIDARYSLQYKERKQNLENIYEVVKASISAKTGNYFIFCPSYEYLSDLKACFDRDNLDIDLYYQEKSMSETNKLIFLSNFRVDNEKTTVGLLVLGGVFSEGIDLVGDRLIGAIIISIGLPQLNYESDKMVSYYQDEEDSKKGFNYAYSYPGFNKVLQAAGRVIRSPEDRGFILFIDKRFTWKTYRDVLIEQYPQAIKAISASQVKATLTRFFKEDKNEIH